MADVDESVIARLSGWYRQRPTSIEFWELVLTDRRLIWCFVGESFKSLLLRADMGERGRDAIDDLPPADVAAFDERNFTVPLSALESIRLRPRTRFRRPVLTVTWRETARGDRDPVEAGTETKSRELHGTSTAPPHESAIAALDDDDRLAHVSVSIDRRGLFG
ncbi:hypothetical protein ACNS7O_05200 [Haloferacaceae archaeon DSL9]